MGKITSMHFAAWKMGLKTGMYYLRTMAASAPIQFTVDQEQLKVVDTNIARVNGLKKRPSSRQSYSSTPVPKPMYMEKTTTPAPNGMPTPAQTPEPETKEPSPVDVETKKPNVLPSFKADAEEGDSPKALPTEPAEKPKEEELLEGEKEGGKESKQSEDTEESQAREGDIYAQKVLACKFSHS